MRKKIQIYFLFFIWLIGYNIHAQNPICQITNFSPTVKGISFGAPGASSEHCYFWINSPSVGEIQIACYESNNPIPVKNLISTLHDVGSWPFSDGTMSWIIKPGEFHLVGAAGDGIEVKEDGTF